MKAQELRIGNLVIGLDGEVSPIIWIDKMQVGVDFDEDGFIEHLKPIPLTEEWLIKLGFRLHFNNTYSFQELSHKYMFMVCVYDGVFSFKDIFSIKIQYVHQLQNLVFALTGEEITIEKSAQ